MNENGDDYFTIWYGVYNRVNRQLVYACAGHPPAILLSEASTAIPVKQLGSLSIPIGMLLDAEFDDDFCEIQPDTTCTCLVMGFTKFATRWKYLGTQCFH
jgi:sigma-B regulation protein RsbU (phosphoserine phosphatase)